MFENPNECDCPAFKKLFESRECGQTLSAADQSRFDLHAANCRACSGLLAQHAEILELAAHMPQFDVSEGLTQKILESVEKQSTPGVEVSLLPVGLFAGLAFLVMVPFDSWQSLYSWAVGILGLTILQFLMKTANSREQVI